MKTVAWGTKPVPEPVLRRLHLEDAPEAFALSQLVGWTVTLADWQRVINWGGPGCFGIWQGKRLLATATTTGYGHDRAWIGMVIVHPEHRRKGLGRQVTAAAMNYLQGRGVQCMMLDASDLGRPLYEAMGFRSLYNVEVWAGRASDYLGARARPLRKADLPQVIALDARIFGVSRARVIRRLVADHPNHCWVEEMGGELDGFILTQPAGDHAAHIGPWMARSPWSAERLLRTALSVLIGREVRINIPDRNTRATAFAANYDLHYQRHGVRMIYGRAEAPDEIVHQLYGTAAMATG